MYQYFIIFIISILLYEYNALFFQSSVNGHLGYYLLLDIFIIFTITFVLVTFGCFVFLVLPSVYVMCE